MELTGLLYQTAQRRGCWQETTMPCRPCVPLDSFLTWRTLLLQPPAQGLFTEGLNRYDQSQGWCVGPEIYTIWWWGRG